MLLVVAGCLALAGALVPRDADTATAVVHPSQSSSIDDTASTRRIQLMAGGLAVLGIGLIGITVWFWRSTRPDPEALAPLEIMGRRRWRRLDTIEQRHRLDDVRAHLNDEAAVAARETVAPAPIVPAPESPDVVVPAAVASGDDQPDDGAAVRPVATEGDASGDGVADDEVSDVEVSGDEVLGDEVSGEHAKVHGDPLVRAMEKDAGSG
jgi:hypothetical protein